MKATVFLAGLLFFLLLYTLPELSSPAFAQGENNHWRFGSGQGIDFTPAGPVRVTAPLQSQEGCAAVSDAGGNLLFYSDGHKIWDASGAVMPNGSGLLGNGQGYYATGSASQGVAVVKAIGHPGQYYVFVLESDYEIGLGSPGYLRYSIVDMTLNGGLGDVVSGQKNLVIDSFMSEVMTVAKGAQCNYWLLTHRRNSAEYHTFRIDENGVDPAPVISVGSLSPFIIGELKLSPDEKIAALLGAGNTSIDIEMASFDRGTGQLSGHQLMGATVSGSYGVAFSPDNRKFYYTEAGQKLIQHDLGAYPSMAAILATRTVITPQVSAALMFRMRLGPDGKIYLAKEAFGQGIGPSIARINNPNTAGVACGFDTAFMAVPLAETFFSFGTTIHSGLYGFGLGQDIVVMDDALQHHTSRRDSLVCKGDAVTLSGRAGCNAYLWSDGSTGGTATFTTEGLYWVTSIMNCVTYTDTIGLRFAPQPSLPADTFLCRGAQLLLDASLPGASYRWQDGSTAATYMVTQRGIYTVHISGGGCDQERTIRVAEADAGLTLIVDDTVICAGRSTRLTARIFPEGHYQWSNGSTADHIEVSQGGRYTVVAQNVCGSFSAAAMVTLEDCNCPVFLPTAFSPNGDGQNEIFMPLIQCRVSGYQLRIFNRLGQLVFTSLDSRKGWNGLQQGLPADVGVYFFDLDYTGVDSGISFRKKGDLTLLR